MGVLADEVLHTDGTVLGFRDADQDPGWHTLPHRQCLRRISLPSMVARRPTHPARQCRRRDLGGSKLQLGSFTVDFRRHYDSKEKLHSPECRSVLFAPAILLRLDTSRMESRHAWLRRLLRVKGQTWVHELAQASADWVLLRERIIEGLDHEFVESDDKEQNDEDGIAPGGGSCRAFLSKWLPEHPMQGFALAIWPTTMWSGKAGGSWRGTCAAARPGPSHIVLADIPSADIISQAAG